MSIPVMSYMSCSKLTLLVRMLLTPLRTEALLAVHAAGPAHDAFSSLAHGVAERALGASSARHKLPLRLPSAIRAGEWPAHTMLAQESDPKLHKSRKLKSRRTHFGALLHDAHAQLLALLGTALRRTAW